MFLHESDVAPVKVTVDAVGAGVLVFAPHPDDEVFGCGGLLALAAGGGLDVTVIVLTDGGRQAPDDPAQRERESAVAAAALGYDNVVHWRLPDRSLAYQESLIQRVCDAIPVGVGVVLAPSLWEVHPDHRVCSMVVAEAIRRRAAPAELWFYEVSAPLRATVALDISSVWSAKARAMAAFESQNACHPYAESVEGLNRYRALGFNGASHAEAFERCSGLADVRTWWHGDHLSTRLNVSGVPVSARNLPLVTVMIRTTGRQSLERALDSVFAQTYPHIEVLVIDATPQPRELKSPHAGHVRRVGGQRALGRSAAANLGLESARGEWLIFLDDDDWFYPDHVSKLVQVSWLHAEVQAFYTDVEGVNECGEPTGVRFEQPYGVRELRYGNFLPIHSVLFSRRLVASGTRFDEAFDLYEDWDFWLQVETSTLFVRVPGVSAAYFHAVGSGEGVSAEWARARAATEQVFAKWGVRLDAVAFQELVSRSLQGRGHLRRISQLERQLAESRQDLVMVQGQVGQALSEADQARQDAHALRLAHDRACEDRDRTQTSLTVLVAELESRRQDLTDIRSETKKARNLSAALQHELNLARAANEALHSQRDQLNIRIWQGNERLLASLATEKQVQHHMAQALLQVGQLTQALEDTHSRLFAALQQAESWKLRFEQVVSSRSWLVTRPLRWLTRLNSSFRRMGVWGTLRRTAQVLEQEGVAGLVQRAEPLTESVGPLVSRTYQDWISAHDTIRAPELAALAHDLEQLKVRPLVSIVMPVYNPPEADLLAAIESVRSQLYGNWELCMCDDASTEPHVARVLASAAEQDARIKWVRHDRNAHISVATNSAIGLATGEFVAFLDHDDALAPHALLRVVQWFQVHPVLQVVYSDEDKLNPQGERFDPYFKPDFNLSLLRSHNYMCHFAVYRKDLLIQLEGIRKGFEGAQDHDLALRAADAVGPECIGHIPHVLYHWRVTPGSTAGGHQQKSYAFQAGQKAISEHLARRGLVGVVEEAPEAPGMYRVVWGLPENPPLVSIVIPTRNGEALLRKCLDSLRMTAYSHYEVLVIDNGSDDPDALAFMQERQQAGEIRILHDPSPFNYSALNNRAVQEACRGELVLLMNNDIEVTHASWLGEMVGHALEPGVGCVGARLWYPDGRLQHGGVIMVCGVAGHAHKYLPKGQHGYMGRAVLAQEFLAVTAACLLVRREIYVQVGGLDESLKVAFNDVDFCLRVHAAGYRNVWTPFAELIHHESVTRGHEDTPEKQQRFAGEVAILQSRWPEWIANDPCYSPNLTNLSEDFSWAWPPRRTSP